MRVWMYLISEHFPSIVASQNVLVFFRTCRYFRHSLSTTFTVSCFFFVAWIQIISRVKWENFSFFPFPSFFPHILIVNMLIFWWFSTFSTFLLVSLTLFHWNLFLPLFFSPGLRTPPHIIRMTIHTIYKVLSLARLIIHDKGKK